MDKIDLLDHGFVRLVDTMGSDLSIARAARVSFDAAWRAGEDEGSDARLIRYLWRNHHTTPFEAVTFTFEVKAPIFVFRQWHRHRTWSFNELSARYRELPEEYYIPDPAMIGVQSTRSKQARDILDNMPDRSAEAADVRLLMQDAFIEYRRLLTMGWPRELARSVLPVATYSHMFATVDLLNLLKFLTLRCDAHAQYEIRVYAEAMRDLARQIVPVAIAAWEQERLNFQGRVAPWMQECFGPTISADRVERGDRLLEEVLELLQSGGYDRERVATLVDYVWGRPVGEPDQEAGGVMVTLAAYCLAHDLDLHQAGDRELARISRPEIVKKIRAKQAAKALAIGASPLPEALQS